MIDGPAADPIALTEKPPPAGVATSMGCVIPAGRMKLFGTVGVPSTGKTTVGVVGLPATGALGYPVNGAVTTHTSVLPRLINSAALLWLAPLVNTATEACCAAATDKADVGPTTLYVIDIDMICPYDAVPTRFATDSGRTMFISHGPV